MEIYEHFWKASLVEIKQGYHVKGENVACLICGQAFQRGHIYPMDDHYLEAEPAVRQHIRQQHGSVFEYLLEFNPKYTGLTSHQKRLLQWFHQGLSDKAIIQELQSGSPATIRNYRFTFREKEKQAKIFLAIMELLKERQPGKEPFVELPRGVRQVDERFALTETEYRKMVAAYFPEGHDGPLRHFPKKEKRKIAVLRALTERFDSQKRYSEPQVNAILKAAWEDFATLRRYLIEYGFLDRKLDGSEYWVKP